MDDSLRKFPRTPHLSGSRLQPGDEDLAIVSIATIRGRHLVVEEKIDGANSAISFSQDGRLLLQSRGHYLTGGQRERHFALFKQWANTHIAALRQVLASRYIMYGEWIYAKHTVFYTDLPHYFLEFDVLDRETDCFLDTPARRRLLAGLPIVSVPILMEGTIDSRKDLLACLGRSSFICKDHLAILRQTCDEHGQDYDTVVKGTDPSNHMEGLYVKVEENGIVKDRYKLVRSSFRDAVDASGEHWLDRPILPNCLEGGADLFGGTA